YIQDNDFRQSNTFFYFTELETQDAWIVMTARAPDSVETALFLPPRNPARERWTGLRLGPDSTAVRLSGIAIVLPTDSLEGRLRQERRRPRGLPLDRRQRPELDDAALRRQPPADARRGPGRHGRRRRVGAVHGGRHANVPGEREIHAAPEGDLRPRARHSAGCVRLGAPRRHAARPRPDRTDVHAGPFGHAVRRPDLRHVLHSRPGTPARHGRARRERPRAAAARAGHGVHDRARDLPAAGEPGG